MGPNWTQAEGFILGVGAKLFSIAGQGIVYDVSATKRLDDSVKPFAD